MRKFLKAYEVYNGNVSAACAAAGAKRAAYYRWMKSHSELCRGFRERLKENKHIDAKESFQRLDVTQLDADRGFASLSNPAVKRLVKWRNNFFVHRSVKIFVRKIQPSTGNAPTFADFRLLLETGMDIIDRYSGLFERLTDGRTIIGHDDFKNVLESVRVSQKLHRAKLKSEIERYEKGR